MHLKHGEFIMNLLLMVYVGSGYNALCVVLYSILHWEIVLNFKRQVCHPQLCFPFNKRLVVCSDYSTGFPAQKYTGLAEIRRFDLLQVGT